MKDHENDLTEFEILSKTISKYVVVSKLLCQAIGYKRALYLATLARMQVTMKKKKDKEGYFCVDYDYIKDDIGMTKKVQMPISQWLEDNHYISTKLSDDGHHKWYKVNDYYCAR